MTDEVSGSAGRAPPARPGIIVGVSGATGVIYALRLLELLRELEIETHLVVTRAGEQTAAYELAGRAGALRDLATVTYPVKDVGAAISSGSFATLGMIVAPCSMNTVAQIAAGTTTNLLTRAADVCLKERRRLVLMVRESPLHAGHLRSMLAVTEYGGIIAPPVPAFYTRPQSLQDVIDHTVGRVLDLFGLDAGVVPRWEGTPQKP
ncbi:MAG: 3-octaprenyl-4-hydroxybenzoate carboxy-lyase [Gammaproteobacteria bacterium]|jgi:4-hydroxy-3-polyprenylbenzoate decarboxylase|nr:3-octaprenyl-4-hydroxybenzoate carboxy-lyase [Gammaproteobacteria bacterium]